MTNLSSVCLFFIIVGCTCVSYARQVPKECAKGPEVWCQSLKNAADCGAVGHCIATDWEKQVYDINKNEISFKFIRIFKQLKDIKDLIDEKHLASWMSSACRDVPYPAIGKICRENTAYMEKYLSHVLVSETSPETMCHIIGMCNNPKVDNIIALNKKKTMDTEIPKQKLLGSEQCTWGPSYWCSNFSTGHECKATHHCIEHVWSKMTFPEDRDDICKICVDMVKQARDQLQSNETQEDLKLVFEGSCKLIPLSMIAKECVKLADDFVPELVETLASQMNPQAVCSVAGLCNNARIDKMLEDYKSQLEVRQDCGNCRRTVGIVKKRFEATNSDDFLMGLLQVCRDFGSFSDSCSMLVFKYYENIVDAVKKDFTPVNVCHLSGQCNYMFHLHNDFVFTEQNIGELKATDDVPCEFCEQLVKHLRDVLVANTTEIEFRKVLSGLCNQTGGFRSECNQLVEQYYSAIYKFLVSDLKPDEACALIGICGKRADEPISPLLPKELSIKAITPSSKLIGTDEANSYKRDKLAVVPIANKQANVRIMGAESAPLPIERMFITLPQSQTKCSFCQYFLHYLQVELSDVKTESEIENVVQKACDKLPQSVYGECKQFVTEYGPMVISLLVQEIDPASVCPALGLCPKTQEVRRVSINSDKSNCPLCLFAVEQLETMLENNRTEASIRSALDKLCNHLSQKLRTECVDFVDTYSNQLVETLLADLNAQEVCVYLKLCKAETADSSIIHSSIDKYHDKPQLRGDRNNYKKSLLPKQMLEIGTGGDIETNEIPDNTVNGRPVKIEGQKQVCVVCEFVMKEIDEQIKDKHNEDEIKKIVRGVCKHMPKSVKPDCDQFVEKYADLVIALLAQELEPAEVCEELKLCPPNTIGVVKEEILDCAVCESVVMAVKKVLNNDKVDRNIVHIVEKSCDMLPAKYTQRCHTLMEIYGDSVIRLIETYGVKDVCSKIGFCAATGSTYVDMYSDSAN